MCKSGEGVVWMLPSDIYGACSHTDAQSVEETILQSLACKLDILLQERMASG